MKKPVLFLTALFLLALTASQVQAQMSGSSYKINWDSINTGGGEDLTGSSYHMYSTVSEVGPGASSGSTYNLDAGYQQNDWELSLSMIVEGQASSPATTYSAFDNSGLTVSIASSTGFAADDYILVVENEGEDQMVAVGMITGITGSGPYTVAVDKWSGDNAAMSATPAGGDDVIYELNGGALDLGTLNSADVKTGVSMLDVTNNNGGGYDCGVMEDGNFRDGTNEINDVADGDVSLGSEEYGIEKTGDNVSGAGSDVAITGTKTDIATSTGTNDDARTMAIHKAVITPATPAGNYGHTMSYYCTVNF